MTILAITSILILAPSMSSNAFATSHLTYADSVEGYDQGAGVPVSRGDSSQALGPEDYEGDGVGDTFTRFVSL
jgi:hypothetical protein